MRARQIVSPIAAVLTGNLSSLQERTECQSDQSHLAVLTTHDENETSATSTRLCCCELVGRTSLCVVNYPVVSKSLRFPPFHAVHATVPPCPALPLFHWPSLTSSPARSVTTATTVTTVTSHQRPHLVKFPSVVRLQLGTAHLHIVTSQQLLIKPPASVDVQLRTWLYCAKFTCRHVR